MSSDSLEPNRWDDLAVTRYSPEECDEFERQGLEVFRGPYWGCQEQWGRVRRWAATIERIVPGNLEEEPVFEVLGACQRDPELRAACLAAIEFGSTGEAIIELAQLRGLTARGEKRVRRRRGPG